MTRSGQQILAALISFSLSNSEATEGFPARACALNLKPSVQTPSTPAIGRADLEKSIFLSDSSVKNQGRYGCCWISAMLGRWERRAATRFGREIPLSENHMIMASLFYRVEEGLYFGSEITQGGWAESSEWMARRVGLVPESAFTPKIDLRDKYVGKGIVDALNFRISKFQLKLAAMKRTGATEDEVWKFAQSEKSAMYAELRERVGNFPSSFIVDGQRYTPVSFAAAITPKETEFVPLVISPKEKRIPRQPKLDPDVVTSERSLMEQYPSLSGRLPRRRFREIDSYTLYGKTHTDELRQKTADLPDIHTAIEASLLKGEPVHLSTPMVKAFYKNDSGVMSLGAFNATPEQAKLEKFSGGHAVLITGIYKDPAGNLLGYRIQNSWGNDSGSLGYYFMDRDYFEAFMDDIVVHSEFVGGLGSF